METNTPLPAARPEAPRKSPVASGLGRRGRVVRAWLTAAAVALLLYGTIAGADDMFPFGPFSMYAGHYPPDGVVTSNELIARTASGRDVVVREADIGLTRAEMEGELGQFEADPTRLADLATAYHQRHPKASPYVALRIVRERWRLQDRAVVDKTSTTLAWWSAR